MKHFTVTFQPDGRQVSIHPGATLLDAAGLAGIVLNTICGEKGTCGKCAVVLQPAGQTVLACQYHVTENLTVLVPPDSRFVEHKILTDGATRKDVVGADIYKKYLSAAGNRPILGLAVDIGTTTVVAKLIDMKTGRLLATCATLNPQTKFGDDVISRISYAKTGAKLKELNELIAGRLNDLIDDCCRQANAKNNDIYETCVVGNTTMHHIFLQLPVTQLGEAPYKAFSLDTNDSTPAEIGLRVNPAGNVHTVANIAGFVGGDTTAVALATSLDSADQMTLVIDIGTNGEVLLGTKDKLIAASCAAGPAFEGARIACGSRAADGAIEAVVLDKHNIAIDVIGGGKPVSICGSGIIDAVAVMLDSGVIDFTGRFKSKISLPLAIAKRVSTITKANGPAFILAYKGHTPAVYLTQQDIREVQLAKSAIRAGIHILQHRFKVADADIKAIYLAGAFGNYIRRQSALRIGLLPNVPVERIHSVGNAASSGAQLILVSSRFRALAADLARRIEYIEIANDPFFQSVFADSMLF
ncbi:MAG: ASKHA domain-containing protein [Sedimentisphaerales bacterium]|jgi:uncharacterized 2Fe-2S/4Fe-4S cluster protein (DUF4445 family)